MKIHINFDDETALHLSSPTKRKVANFLRGHLDKSGVFSGTARVAYSGSYVNSFDFTDKDDLEYKLYPCMEEDLVNEFARKAKR